MPTNTHIQPYSPSLAPPPPVVVPLNLTDLTPQPLQSVSALIDLSQKLPAQHFHPSRQVTPGPSSVLHRLPVQQAQPIGASPSSSPTPSESTGSSLSSPAPSPAPIPPNKQQSKRTLRTVLQKTLVPPTPSSRLSSSNSTPRPAPNAPRKRQNKRRALCAVPQKMLIPCLKSPSRLGNKLHKLVPWDSVLFEAIRNRTRVLMNQHLNIADCYRNQDTAKLAKVIHELKKDYPDLDNYEDCWPINVILMGLLKYRSSANKSARTKKAVQAVREQLHN